MAEQLACNSKEREAHCASMYGENKPCSRCKNSVPASQVKKIRKTNDYNERMRRRSLGRG